jgi:thioredoxin-like negative regulator of GroEL
MIPIRTVRPGLIAVCAAFCLAQSAAAQQVEWRYDYNKARQEAAAKALPLLLDFGREGCIWCTQLDARTFTDPEVRTMLNERFIPVKIDGNRYPDLVEKLSIRSYPTVVFASAEGRILYFQEGFVEAPKMREHLIRTLTATSTPEWMAREYQEAVKSHGSADYARTVSLLKNIVEDGKERPVQLKARELLSQVENAAAAQFAQGRDLLDRNQTKQGMDVLSDVIRLYPGTPAARESTMLLQSLAGRNEGVEDRARKAKELLARAREDYKAQLYLCCLDRCEVLVTAYSDLPEAAEASQLAMEIKTNPDWTKAACDQLADRMAMLYLSLADAHLKRGQPQQATLYLERIVQMFPNTRHSEIAQIRLSQIQGPPSKAVEFKK